MTDPTDGIEEYGRINISLRLGGPPRVTVDGHDLKTTDIIDAGNFLRDMGTATRRDEKPWRYARRMWQQRQDYKLKRQLEVADKTVKRETYLRSRPLTCFGCRQRYKHQESLDRHVAAKHTTHWRGKGGRALCGIAEHMAECVTPGRELSGTTVCVGCEDAHVSAVNAVLDELAESLGDES